MSSLIEIWSSELADRIRSSKILEALKSAAPGGSAPVPPRDGSAAPNNELEAGVIVSPAAERRTSDSEPGGGSGSPGLDAETVLSILVDCFGH